MNFKWKGVFTLLSDFGSPFGSLLFFTQLCIAASHF